MATKEDIDKLEEATKCAICFDRLQNPKSLNCKHSFCLACLEKWVKKKRTLTCQTCTKTYPIPEGGLQKLPTDIFLIKLLETLEQYAKKDQIMKCRICGQGEKYYCHDCGHYLCCSCRDNHEKWPIMTNHKINTVEKVRSMTAQEFASLNPPLCSLHSELLELYCQDCKTPICLHCTFTVHKEGRHKTVSISEAFQTFKATSETLVEAADDCHKKLDGDLRVVDKNDRKLKQSRDAALQDIDRLVEDIHRSVTKTGNEIKEKAEEVYKEIKQVNDEQVSEIRTKISDLNTKVWFLNMLLNGDEATAMKSIETAKTALQDRINETSKTEPKDSGQIVFTTDKRHIASLLQCDIGKIEMQTKAAELTLKRRASASQGPCNSAKVMKTIECNVDENQWGETWTHPTSETNIAQLVDYNGDNVVTGKSNSPGPPDIEPITQSPIIIKEKERLVNTIQISQKRKLFGVAWSEYDCLMVSCGTNEIYKYKQSGEYIGTITLPKGVEIFSMYKMENGIAVSDEGRKKCISIVKMNGEVIKSIGQGVLRDPAGIHVDEASNAVYVADWRQKCVFMFDIESGDMIRKVQSPGEKEKKIHDVTLTNQGLILALERDPKKYSRNTLQLFDNKGRFIEVLVKGDEHGIGGFREVVVDDDDNIILVTTKKIHHFSSDGSFIKRIDKPEDGITNIGAICLISQHPRRLAVVNNGDKTIKIYNY